MQIIILISFVNDTLFYRLSHRDGSGGTSQYTAPEVLLSTGVERINLYKADVYSMSLVSWELLSYVCCKHNEPHNRHEVSDDVTCCCGDVTWCCGDVMLCCGDVTWCCGDVTWCCGDVTWCCGDVTWCCDDVTWCCGDVTWCCGDVTWCCDVVMTLLCFNSHGFLFISLFCSI